MNQKQTLVHQIVTLLLSVTAVPLMYWGAVLFIRADLGLGLNLGSSLGALGSLLGSLGGSSESKPPWEDFISLSLLRRTFSGESKLTQFFSGFKLEWITADIRKVLLPGLIGIALVFLAALVLLAAGIVGMVRKKNKPVLLLCAAAGGCILTGLCFFRYFGNKVTNPGFDLMAILGSGELSKLLSLFVDPTVLVMKMSWGVFLLFVLCGLVALWRVWWPYFIEKQKPVPKRAARRIR
ncbi:MAG: hypothetical protein LBR73_04480 [Oscillospiraceae bacterium]|jgi:hypothetical protein|nr:hypothetical protein [Oscillospiraceae bacterium]